MLVRIDRGSIVRSVCPAPAIPNVVVLLWTHPVHASAEGPIVGAVSGLTPLTHVRTVLPIIPDRDVRHPSWLRVRLPKRPNDSTGWITTQGTQMAVDPWSIVVDRARRSAQIYRSGRQERVYKVIVGRPSLPTPAGIFYVTETLSDRGHESGPYGLATSAYSNFLHEFDGGLGQVALHGRERLKGAIGTASSHGCVRFGTAAITWLAQHIPQGTSIVIR